MKGWDVSVSDDGKYVYLERGGKPGKIQIKADDEGFVVDFFDADQGQCIASTYAYYSEMESQ